MTTGELAIVFATLMGPVLAVQAQKWLERRAEKGSRKDSVFTTLMATRGTRLSTEHVQALNMIDLVFYGTRAGDAHHRTQSEQAVVDAWREYLDHLSYVVPENESEAARVQRETSREELFLNLLQHMASERRYEFDRVQLRKGAYFPNAHGQAWFEQEALRKLLVRFFAGQNAVRVVVAPATGAPADAARVVAEGAAPQTDVEHVAARRDASQPSE